MIRLEGVIKWFGRPVLQSVDLSVPRGCLYGLVGPGASGKSVLLKIVAGLVRPDSGSVFVADQDLFALSDLELERFRTRIGMLFQNNALFDFMTVSDNVAFPLRRLSAGSDAEIADRVAERLERVGLSSFGDRMPAGLSGGQKKRVGVARATATNAEILLYDEPAAGLDPVMSQKMFDLLRNEQRRRGATVIMVSSDLPRLLPVTDRMGMLLDGRLVFDGTYEQAKVSDNPYVRQFVNGDPEGPL